MFVIVKDNKITGASTSRSTRDPDGVGVVFEISEDDYEKHREGYDVRVDGSSLVFYQGERYEETLLKPLVDQYKQVIKSLREKRQMYENLVDLGESAIALEVKQEIEDINASLEAMKKRAKDDHGLSDEQIKSIIKKGNS